MELAIPNISKYLSLLNVSPRPHNKFNETIGPNGRFYLSFNEAGNRLLPAVVQSNLEFFSALRIIGLFPVSGRFRSVYFPHKRRFNVLSQVQMTSTTTPVVGFKVPELGYPVLCKSLISKCMVYDGEVVAAQNQHLIVRAREMLIGEEVVVFGVEYTDRTQYYMWDVDHVYPVEASAPALLMRNGNHLTLVTDDEDFKLNMPFTRVNWTTLHADLVAKDKDMILDIDGQLFSVYSEPTVKVKVENNIAYDSCYDKVGIVNAEDGYYRVGVNDVSVISKLVTPVADPPQVIHRARACYVKTSALRDHVIVPKSAKPYSTPILDLSPCATFVKSYNVGAVHVPYFQVPPRSKKRRIDYYKDFLRTVMFYTESSLVKMDSTGYSKFLAQNYLYANYDQIFKLSWTPLANFCVNGISNYARPDTFMVVYKDVPDEIKHICRYYLSDRMYLLFFDIDKWHYSGNSYQPDNVEL